MASAIPAERDLLHHMDSGRDDRPRRVRMLPLSAVLASDAVYEAFYDDARYFRPFRANG